MPKPAQSRPLTFLRWTVLLWGVSVAAALPLIVAFDPLHGWRWAPLNPVYDQMIVSIYVALGIMLIRASREPFEHWSLLQFTVLSSVLHGGVMLYHAVAMPMYHGHLWGDVWILGGAAWLAVAMALARRNPGLS